MTLVDIGIPGVNAFPQGTHICALYSGSAERDELLFPFLREGLRHGDTCLCFIDGLEPGAVRAQAVAEAGVADPSTDRFDVRPASEVYLQLGRFSVEHMTSVLTTSSRNSLGWAAGMDNILPVKASALTRQVSTEPSAVPRVSTEARDAYWRDRNGTSAQMPGTRRPPAESWGALPVHRVDTSIRSSASRRRHSRTDR